jgi:hypothetical protein
MFPESDPIDERNGLRLELLQKVRHLTPYEAQSLLAYLSGWAPEEMDAAWYHWRNLRDEIDAMMEQRQMPPQ